MTDVILRTEHLKKHFGTLQAVKDLSLEVRRGEVFGFLGPNGAGKTTAIGMMLGLLYPTGGTVEIFGQPVTPQRTSALRKVGALVGATPALFPFLSARKNVELVARMNPEITPQAVDEVLALVNLEQEANRKAGRFSTGMKQRLGLAIALIHKPDLLILDEPTNGMDPAGMREVRTLLRSLADAGTTVFVSSHLLHEIEQICDRVAVLKKGMLVAQGSVKELLSEDRGSVVRVRVDSPSQAATALASLSGVSAVEPNGAYVTITGPSSQQVVRHLTSQGIIPIEVTTSQGDLESLFMELTAEEA
jgi:ABC-2 type transport system ATP-binding protein